MKFLLVILIGICAITACDNGSGSSARTDSTIKSIDSTIKATADTLKTATDSLAKKIDSSGKAIIDSAKLKMNAAVDTIKKSLRK